MIEHLFFFILFGIIGVTLEVLSTSIKRFKKTKKKSLMGDSSIWMFLMSGIVYFIILFVTRFFMDFNILARGFIYMIFFYIIEFSFGYTLKKFKSIPWNYSRKKKYDFKGIICLEYSILWYALGIIAELLYFYLQAHISF